MLLLDRVSLFLCLEQSFKLRGKLEIDNDKKYCCMTWLHLSSSVLIDANSTLALLAMLFLGKCTCCITPVDILEAQKMMHIHGK